MAWVLVALVVFPFVVAVATYVLPVAISKVVSVVAGSGAFALALALVPSVADHAVTAGSLLRVDALSVVFLVATAFLYATTAVFSVGYLHVADSANGRRYGRRFYAGLNLFCWSMLAAPLVNGFALLWVAVEITTVVSALLVAIDDTDEATEASWKYVLIASMGLGIALFATIFVYYAGSKVFGAGYDLSYVKLVSGASHLPPSPVRLAFILAVLGFGTKMGLVPVHTWLPDAHSEAPTPVSALLSGALLAIAFYAILRYYQVAERTLGPTFPRDVLLAFGLASLLLAALYLLSQRDMKRLLAYSSVEHMGILAIGMSFGATIAIVGVLLHVLAHAAAKGTAFFGAGSMVRKFATKDMRRIRGGIGALPWSGPMLVAAVLALSAMPPFGIFRSEFLIVRGGLADPHDVVTAVLVVLVSVAFLGLSWATTKTMLTPEVTAEGTTAEGTVAEGTVAVGALAGGTVAAGALAGGTVAAGALVTPPKGEVSRWIVAAMVLGLLALVLLGVHPPAVLDHLLARAAHELGAPR